jgi:hypothetical protein
MFAEVQRAASAPGAPPLTREAVFEELNAAYTDPSHAMHRAAQAGLPRFDDWVEGLYKRIPGHGGGAVDLSNDINVVDTTVEETAHKELQKSVAEGIEQRGIDTAAMRAESAKLFAGAEGQALADLFDDRTLAGLSSNATKEAHVAMAQWMSDLAALRSAPSGDDPDANSIGPSNFQERYVEALRDAGINVDTLDKAINGIFAGRPELYKHFIAQLDKFPPGQRLAAYVRSAEAVMNYVRLRQYVS